MQIQVNFYTVSNSDDLESKIQNKVVFLPADPYDLDDEYIDTVPDYEIIVDKSKSVTKRFVYPNHPYENHKEDDFLQQNLSSNITKNFSPPMMSIRNLIKSKKNFNNPINRSRFFSTDSSFQTEQISNSNDDLSSISGISKMAIDIKKFYRKSTAIQNSCNYQPNCSFQSK
jgi:hypothetical protein